MATILSREKWNPVGVHVLAGKIYRYEATGRWKDWYIECDADGYSSAFMNLTGWAKRVRDARWFQLIAIINKDPRYVLTLGKAGSFVAPADGDLWAFANDASFFYGNNSGSIEFQVSPR